MVWQAVRYETDRQVGATTPDRPVQLSPLVGRNLNRKGSTIPADRAGRYRPALRLAGRVQELATNETGHSSAGQEKLNDPAIDETCPGGAAA